MIKSIKNCFLKNRTDIKNVAFIDKLTALIFFPKIALSYKISFCENSNSNYNFSHLKKKEKVINEKIIIVYNKTSRRRKLWS